MLISHSHRFIFIHVYKNAGSSIKHALADYNYKTYGSTGWVDKWRFVLGLYPKHFSQDYPGHVKSVELKEKMDNEVFSTYFKFAVVRNPFDWQVSLYNYARMDTSHHQHELTKSFGSFDEYFEWRVNGNFSLQSDFVCDSAGDLLVDRVLRFERLGEDFKDVCDYLNINGKGLPHRNISKEGDYKQYYSPDSANMVRQNFGLDFEVFGYFKKL
ncbi:MAG: sulfotransferase family 2 domain-containing protein [Marinoscillum sp.]